MSTLISHVRSRSADRSKPFKSFVWVNTGLLAAWTLGGALASGDALSESAAASELATAASPSPSSVSESESPQFSSLIAALETEAARLNKDFQQIDREATRLIGPTDSQKRRQPKLPSEHAELVSYLKGCVSLVEKLGESFGALVVCDEHVDLRERVEAARTNLQRLQKMGGAGVLVRRQARGWVEKDMEAVDALYAEWPQIEKAVAELVAAARDVESGREGAHSISEAHKAVLRAARFRTHFEESQLGVLCRKVHDNAGRAKHATSRG